MADQRLHFGQKLATERRQLGPLSGPVKEPGAEKILQPKDLLCQRWLRDLQSPGRFAEMAKLAQDRKRFDQGKIHRRENPSSYVLRLTMAPNLLPYRHSQKLSRCASLAALFFSFRPPSYRHLAAGLADMTTMAEWLDNAASPSAERARRRSNGR
jgi:hypothetical protein